jgi:opacity protein-like surface antigen
MGEIMRLRSVLCGVVLIALAGEACAADMPDFLRGSQTVINASGPVRWDGVYVGAHGGMSVSGADFTSTDTLMTALLGRTLPVTNSSASSLGKADTTGSHFGGFVGYNWQFDDTVISVEGNYSRINNTITATDAFVGTAFAPDGNRYPFTGSGSSTLHMTDVANFRMRAGWAAGSFLPYAFVGVAAARADVSRTVAVNYTVPAGTPPFAQVTGTEDIKDRFGFGYTAGFGLDYAVMRNFFLRAEYEYANFNNFESTNAHVHNARLGAAFKF